MLETIKKILSLQKKAIGKHKFYALFYFGFFTSIILFIEPFFFIKIISAIENFYKTGNFNFLSLTWYIGGWLLFMVFSIFCNYIYHYYFVDKSNLLLYVDLFKKYSKINLEITYAEYLGHKSGELYSIIRRGVPDTFSFLYFFYFEIVRGLTGVIFMIIVLIFIHPIMALASLSMLPVIIFVGIFFQNKTLKLQKDINDFDDENYGILSDSVTNLSLTKTLAIESSFFHKLKTNIHTSLDRQLIVSKRWTICNVYTGVIVMFARILTILIGTYLVSIGNLSLAFLFLYFTLISWIYFPISIALGRMRIIQAQLTSAKKMFDVFDALELESDLDSGKKIKNPQGDIVFHKVCFEYIQDKPVLKNLDLNISVGQKIAFVGNTGAGKSTLVNLLLRFWDVTAGSITLDGEDIKNIKKSSLRGHIGVVSQDNSLFNMSIKENLLFAKKEATKKDLEAALKKAQADFVLDLEHGIDTVIGERGLKLSGGEKQRLSIARLFLKDPKILILDEATSALDNKTEKLVQKALDTLMKGRTSIIIAHRLSTIQHADVIYMLENGQIVESGNYEQLMTKKQKFYELANPDHLIIN